tara:strand:- start:2355 stop:2873 length:519 start_codon:yes stop_codon:yes gene_type:complete
MLISIFGYFFLFVGLLMLVLPLVLVELSRPRDWLIGSLFLFLGFFFQVENDLLRGSMNLLVVSMTVLYGKMLTEIIQNRWYKLTPEEKNRIGSFDRWLESLKQLSQIFAGISKSVLNFFKSFRLQSENHSKEKKWTHPELKEEMKKKLVDQSFVTNSNTVRNQELTEKEETS